MRALHIVLCKSRLSFSLTNFKAGRVLRCWDLLLSRSHTSISKLKTCFLPGKNATQPGQMQVYTHTTANGSSTPISHLVVTHQSYLATSVWAPPLLFLIWGPYGGSGQYVFFQVKMQPSQAKCKSTHIQQPMEVLRQLVT